MEHLRRCFEHIVGHSPSPGRSTLDAGHNLFLVGAVLSKKPERVLELGIGTGYVTISLIHAMGYNGRGRLTCVDDWSEWGGLEPDGIENLRLAGVEVVAPVHEEDYVKNCSSDSFDVLVSDADPFLSGSWVDEHLRITRDNGFLFFHNTNRKEDYPGLHRIGERVRELGLPHYHFTESSRPDERCGRGWLFVINRKGVGAETDAPAPVLEDREPTRGKGNTEAPNAAHVESPLYLGLFSGRNYGWGICSRYLIQELSKKRTVRVLDGSFSPAYLPFKGKVFQALLDVDFNPLFKEYLGKENYGYTFFENELTEKSVQNAKQFDIVIGGSTWCRDRMLERGIRNCEILIQGIDPEVFYPVPEKRNEDRFVIFSGGKLELRKGQDLVLKAFRILQEKYPSLFLVNCWYNIWPESLKLMAHSPHIRFEYREGPWEETMAHLYRLNDLDSSRIVTCGLIPNEQQRQLYAETDIGVFPNRCEGGTNLVLMEYMACARPVIASNTSGHRDIVTRENALLLDSLSNFNIVGATGERIARWREPSVDELVAQIEYAYHNRDEIRKLGCRAGEDLKRFTWERSAQRLLELIDA